MRKVLDVIKCAAVCILAALLWLLAATFFVVN